MPDDILTYELRPHQTDAIQKLRESFISGKRRPILQAPTGMGKTLIAVDVIKSALSKSKRVLFVVDRVQLVDQTSEVFDRYGIDHGIIQADHWRRNSEPLQIASVQTLVRRRYKPISDLIIIDECHCVHKSMVELLELWVDVRVIGLSATPWTKGLGKIFDDLIVVETTGGLIDSGYLSDFDVYGSTLLDLKGIKTIAGDYNQKDLGKRVTEQKIVGDVVTTWLRRGNDSQTVCFCVNVAHSKAVVDEFMANGVTAAHIDSHTDHEERESVLSAHDAGEIKILSNVGITTKGWDSPNTICCILARPTKSLMLYVQMVGRVLRVSDCGSRAIILDHGRNVERHGFPTDQMPAFLCNGEKGENGGAEENEKKEKLPKPCESCSYMSIEFVCPSCGHTPKIIPGVVAEDGELKKLERVPMADKVRWYAMMKGWCRMHNKKEGFAYYSYNDKFGVYPTKTKQTHALNPDNEVSRFMKSRIIRAAKSNKKELVDINNPLHVIKTGYDYSVTTRSDGDKMIRCEKDGKYIGWAKQTKEIMLHVGAKL